MMIASRLELLPPCESVCVCVSSWQNVIPETYIVARTKELLLLLFFFYSITMQDASRKNVGIIHEPVLSYYYAVYVYVDRASKFPRSQSD